MAQAAAATAVLLGAGPEPPKQRVTLEQLQQPLQPTQQAQLDIHQQHQGVQQHPQQQVGQHQHTQQCQRVHAEKQQESKQQRSNHGEESQQQGLAGDMRQMLSHPIFDRQIRLWGVEAQRRLLSARLLVVGITSINVELLKNMALAGVHATLCDDGLLSASDLTFNFLAKYEDIGKLTAAAATLRGLQAMAPLGKFDCLSQETFTASISAAAAAVPAHGECAALEELLQGYTAVCVAAEFFPLPSLVDVDAVCRKLNVAFCSSHCSGKFGFVFVDFHCHEYRDSSASVKAPLSGQAKAPSVLGAAAAPVANPPAESTLSTKTSASLVHASTEVCAKDAEKSLKFRKKNFPSLAEMLAFPLGGTDEKTDIGLLAYLALLRWVAHQASDNCSISATNSGSKSRPFRTPRYEYLDEDEEFAAFAAKCIGEGGRQRLRNDAEEQLLLRSLSMMAGRQFVVVAAVVGGLLAQELRKYITKEQEPSPNCIVFNFDSSTAAVASIPPPCVAAAER